MAESRTSSVAPDPQQGFAGQLRELRRRMLPEPTEEALARRMECGRSTVSAILNGRRFPNWQLTAAFVEACGGDATEWRERWIRVNRQRDDLRRSARLGSELVTEPAVAVGLLASSDAMLAARWYRSHPEFYAAAAERARQARSEIRLTYIRRYPPTQYTTPIAAEYFKAILAWANEASDDEHCVRRIIGVPEYDGRPDKDMLAWVRLHHEETRDILNYEANVLRWTAVADGLNMALFDDRAVFLAFSGGPRQRLNGFSVESPDFMDYFAGHFDQLWTALPPLSSYLDDLDDLDGPHRHRDD